MKSRRLGRTGLTVSELGFGGIPVIPLSFDDGVAVVRRCYELGITFFDTANAYRDSEKKVGTALAGVREHVVIATKTLRRDGEGAAKHIERSLANLGTDHIDLYQLHNVANRDTLEQVLGPGGAYEAAEKARAEGKIGFIGFSSHNIDTALIACRTNLFSTVQIAFNFIETEPANELFREARARDMGIIAMKPLGGGLLERPDLCFRFLQQYPDVIPIPGFASTAEVDGVVGLYESPRALSGSDLAEMEKIRERLGKRFCHRCGYCLPCEQGVRISEAMIFPSVLKRFHPAAALEFMAEAMKSVLNCTECGACIEKCPYELPVPEMLKESLALFNDADRKHRETAPHTPPSSGN